MNWRRLGLVLVILLAIEIFYISSIPPPEGLKAGNRIIQIAYHFIVFALFTFFLYLTIYAKEPKDNFWFAFIFSIFYAIADELHQLFVPNRVCSTNDIFIDFLGIIFGTILFSIIHGGKLRDERIKD